MKLQFTNREIFILLVISAISLLANLPEQVVGNFIDRKFLLMTLIAVVVIAMFRYLQALLLAVISILAIGANLPEEMAHTLGISQLVLLVSLGILIAVTLLNRVFKLLPVAAELNDIRTSDSTNARRFLLVTISKGDIATLRKLLAMKVGINFTLNGTTPLHLATEKGYSNIVQLLIDHGADYLMVNAQGQTPLDVALAKKKFVQTTDILFNVTMPHIVNPAQSESTPAESK